MAIAAYALVLGVVSGIVRHWFPIDRWVFIGVPVELAHLPQYASLFVLGLLAYRHGWLPDIPERAGRVWLTVGLSLAAFRYAYSLLGWRFLRRTPGGFDWSGLFWGPLTLTALSTLIGVISSYLVAAALPALPGVRRVL